MPQRWSGRVLSVQNTTINSPCNVIWHNQNSKSTMPLPTTFPLYVHSRTIMPRCDNDRHFILLSFLIATKWRFGHGRVDGERLSQPSYNTSFPGAENKNWWNTLVEPSNMWAWLIEWPLEFSMTAYKNEWQRKDSFGFIHHGEPRRQFDCTLFDWPGLCTLRLSPWTWIHACFSSILLFSSTALSRTWL